MRVGVLVLVVVSCLVQCAVGRHFRPIDGSGSGSHNGHVSGDFGPPNRCINVWDEGCANGQLPGSGKDDDYLNGGFNPGKRSCVNVWDDGCANGQLPGSGKDDDYLNGGFNPGKRSCVNVWDDGCANGQLPGSGKDDDYLNGGFNPGKRSLSLLEAQMFLRNKFDALRQKG